MSTMTRRQAIAATVAAPMLAQRRAAPRPNILLILADDLGAWMVGCYGGREIRTPNIDLLARMGVRFSNAFAVSPACSPARATLFTGRLPRQHGIQDTLTGPAPASFAQEVMLSDLLSKNGYRCGYAGKWHLGNDAAPGHGLTDPYITASDDRAFSTEIITGKASEFLDRQSPGSPFFLTVAYPDPHNPQVPLPKQYMDSYLTTPFDTIGREPAAPNTAASKVMLVNQASHVRRSAAAITAMDNQIPLLLKKLEDRKLRDNTLVVFTSDHGFLLAQHGLWGDGHASEPVNMYDEVVRVPMIWHWPGKTPALAIRPELIGVYDFFPTICDAVELDPPKDRKLAGRSYLPVATLKPIPRVKGKEQPWPEAVYGQFLDNEMLREARYKLVLRKAGQAPGDLFDLSEDPRERKNHYGNAAYVTVRDRLTRDLTAWRKRTA